MRNFLKIFLLFIVSPVLGEAKTDLNLALHKTYRLKPNPDYLLCEDKLDLKQLTDGKNLGSYWGDKTTVGWQYVTKPVDITIDLGKIASIQEIRIYTIGGGLAGVKNPRYVPVLVSLDGKSFDLAGIANHSKSHSGTDTTPRRIPLTLLAKNINQQAQFVKVLLEPDGAFVFLDEIEVIGSYMDSANFLAQTKKRSVKIKDPDDVFKLIEIQNQLKENIRSTIDTVQRKDLPFSQDFTRSTVAELSQIDASISQLDINDASLEILQGQLRITRAKIYKEFYKKDYICLSVNPMEILEEKTMQLSAINTSDEMNISLWQKEHESVAVNIINCSPKNLSLSVSLSPLNGPNNIIINSKDTITVRRAIYVNAKKMGLIADPLVLQGNRPFEMHPGEITQIWFGVHNPALKMGTYKGSIGFVPQISEPNQFPIKTMGINITVESFDLAAETKLNTCVWAYPEHINLAKDSVDECAKDLQSHYTNVFVLHPSSVPYLQKKPTAAEGQSEFVRLGRIIEENKYAKTFLIFCAFNSTHKDTGRFGTWMSEEWQNEFSTWLNSLTAFLKQHNIGYDRFALYPFDESLCDEFFAFAKAVKKIDPKVRMYANSFGSGPREFQRFRNLVDVWCLPRDWCIMHPDWLAEIKNFGKEVWTYSADGPGKANQPYSYYRLMPWWAFKNGLTGVGFWVYADPDAELSWDDYNAPRGRYGVVYNSTRSPVDTGGESIVTSRRWEAWREGIEDYIFLEMVQKSIDQIKVTSPAKGTKLQQLFNNELGTVINNPSDLSVEAKVKSKLCQITSEALTAN